MGWNIHQMDVKIAFLNGTIDEEVHIKQPEGVEVNNRDSHVCILKKALYGLKQAPRAWYATMDAYLLRIGFVKSSADPNLYIKVMNNEPIIILLYMDDLFITEVGQKPVDIYLGQGKYIIKLLQKFKMMDSKPMTSPMITNLKKLRGSNFSLVDPTSYRQLVGSLMYLVNTRPYICLTVSILSQFQLEPRHDHLIAAKHILRYLCCTIYYCLKYDSKEVKLIGYTDSDWGGSETDGRSTTRGCFSLGAAMISWLSRKQDPIALCSVEAEYVVACEVGKEVVWLRKLLKNLFEKSLVPTMINCDNQSCIKMFGDPVFHARTEHINNKFHFIRNLVQVGS
eukprot:PITA_32200